MLWSHRLGGLGGAGLLEGGGGEKQILRFAKDDNQRGIGMTGRLRVAAGGKQILRFAKDDKGERRRGLPVR